MSNRVVAGTHAGRSVSCTFGIVTIQVSLTKLINLDKSTIASYEVITEEHRKSAASGIARGLVGGALLGPVGMLAGGLSAKNKGTYQLAVQYKDGGKSLLEIDEKIYKTLVKNMF